MRNLIAVGDNASALDQTIPISVRGKWVDAPAARVNGQDIVTNGKSIKIARLHDEDWVESEITDPEACIAALKERSLGARPDIFCFSQKIPDVTPRYKYPMELRSLAVVPVVSFKDWFAKIPPATRQNIKRAERRGVVIKVKSFDSEVMEGIRDIQNETPVRQGRRFPHYGKSMEEVQRDHGSFAERSDFICAYFEGQFIGFTKLVYRGDTAAIMQILCKMAFYEKRASNAMLAKAVELCSEKKISYLAYELFNYGNKGDTSLREFKTRHGFGEMLVPSYYVPLTLWGKICVQAKLYRGIMGLLPHGVITAGNNLRAKWYERKSRVVQAA